MSKKAPVKIPSLIPSKTLEIEGNKINITGFKASDKVYEIAIRHLQNKAIAIQGRLNKIIRTDDGNIKPDKELTDEELETISQLYDEIDIIATDMLYDENYQMKGPLSLLAQRGLKRFYHPNKTASELDQIDNIPLTEGDAKLIGNTMIALSNPPRGLEKSIKARNKEQADDKGKPEK